MALLVAGCSPEVVEDDQTADGSQSPTEEGTVSQQTEAIQTQLRNDYYRPLLTDGTYQPSQSRGITQNLHSTVNLKYFESGLFDLAREEFDTETHYFQEGQYIDSNVVTAWLSRENPELEEGEIQGLNPIADESEKPDERNPIYLQSILEHNFYQQTTEGYQLSGMTIGLALNSVDYYRTEIGGPVLETKIDRETLISQGQAMGNEIVRQLREMDGLSTIPIVIGFYEQSTRDDIAGGVYFQQGMSQNGEKTISNWKNLNHDRKVFPLEGSESNEGNSFANFKSEVETFFPNLSGVTGIASYTDDVMMHLKIGITTQFYSQGEMIAFTQFVNEMADTYLPPNIPIEITIDSMLGTEAVLYREAGGNSFEGHILY